MTPLKIFTTYRRFIIFSVTILLVLNIGGNFTFAQSKWNETISRQVYTAILSEIESLSLTDATKEEFARICLSKFKKELPNGLDAVSQDRYRTLALKFVKEAVIELNDPNVKYWIISKEDNLYKTLEKRYTTITTDKKSLKTIINCTLNKLFSEYPAGLESISERERFDIYYKLGYECSKQIEFSVIKWTAATEDAIRLKLSSYFKEAGMSELQKTIYTTCFIEKMKKKYPNGMSGNLEKEFEAAMEDCLKNYPEN